MSHPTDLLPYGETFAELDLIVRQLDDGSLTVTDDDGLPDEGRVQILARPAGLVASYRVVPMAEQVDGLADVLGELSRDDVAFVWADGAVRCEVTLPWTEDHQFAPEALRGLYTTVTTSARDRSSALEAVARGELQAPDLVATVAVPPSYLAGAGQSDRGDSLTHRYGAVAEVPGQSEAESAERIQSGRRPSAPSSSSSGPVAVVVILAMVGLAGGAVFMLKAKGPGPTTPPGPEVTPPVEAPDPPTTPTPTQPEVARPKPPAPEPEPAPAVVTLNDEASILEAAGGPDAELRRRAVERWLELGLDAEEGAHLRLLKALNGRIERDMGLGLLNSFREHPVGTLEALDCLSLSNLAIRSHLIQELGHVTGENVDIVAEILGEQEETPDLAVEVALLRLGRPKPGAIGRLVDKYGVAWARGEGKPLIAAVPISELIGLATASKAEVRLLACDLLQQAAGDDALSQLLKLLRDDVERVRQRAIEALTERADPKSSWALARMLATEQDSLTRRMLQSALEALPTGPAVGFLDRLIRAKRTEDRLAALGALQAIAKPAAIPPILRALRDSDRGVRLAGLKALQGLQRQSQLKGEIRKGILDIRRLAADTRDAEARRLARQLHFAVEGTMPPR